MGRSLVSSLITGATKGIGLAGFRRVAAEGGAVLATGTNAQRIESLRGELSGGKVWDNDASDPDTGEQLAELVASADAPRWTGLWLKAGYADIARVDQIDAAFFDRMMAANVRAVFLQLAALSSHLTDGASVVITSSTASVEGSPVAKVYAATKGGGGSRSTGLGRRVGGTKHPGQRARPRQRRHRLPPLHGRRHP